MAWQIEATDAIRVLRAYRDGGSRPPTMLTEEDRQALHQEGIHELERKRSAELLEARIKRIQQLPDSHHGEKSSKWYDRSKQRVIDRICSKLALPF